mmetsp:Transcript_28291/g.40512  ORF Transcript_28291/g.40512 Transcript_28291/m.40512 type:complete len:660 (-) Transcript_28291:98-2077(-)
MTSLLPSPTSKYHESSSSNRPSTLLFNDASNLDEREFAKQAFELAEESLQSQCLENATTFVSVERRGIALQASLQRLLQEECVVVETVAQVRQDLTMQSDNNNSKAKQLQEISQTHQQRRRTLLQHSTLLELLELPNVMDACIRSDLYDEALNIASFANTLERRHDISAANNNNTKGASVVAAVIEEIRAREVELRHYLIQQFTKDITMPQCLELVTALRRLNGIELERTNNNNNNTSRMDRRSGGTADLEGAHSAMELKLQVDFLEARDKWLEKTNMEVPLFLPSSTTTNSTNSNTTNASQQQNEQFLDWIERHRTKCFEIASQFLAIFCTPTSYSTVSDVTNTLTNTHQSTAYSLLSIWCTRRIHMFLSLLQTTQLDSPTALSYTSLSALRDALDATAFFAASMGRIGGDFTPLVTSVFETRVLRIVTRSWKEATESLDHTLRICREAGIASPLVNTNTTTAPSLQQQHRDEEVTAVNAPQALLTYPPLARFVNTFMTSLNDLRRCLLPGTFFPLRTNLTEEVIPNLKIILETNERKLLTPGMLRGDSILLRQLATQYKSVLLEVVEPFLILALNIALGIPCSTTKEAIVDEEEDQGNTTSETENLMPENVVGENDKENTNECIENNVRNDEDDNNGQSEDNFCDDGNSKNAEEESK